MPAEYNVTFVQAYPTGSQAPNSVTIWPTDPNWNDFGFDFRTKARIAVPTALPGVDPKEVETRTVSLFVVPWPLGKNWRFDTWLRDRIAGQAALDSNAVRDQFFTILADVKSYRTVEDKRVEAAMVQFGRSLEAGSVGQQLQQNSLALAHVCRDSLAESWGVKQWRNPHSQSQ
ncbi:hypothetical protein [Paucibacter sp. DJ2R-2]|uniref:hypothetical protein n=1 Tax=Paucibacter sp. DJ2R-2 TaxID=2893558 RepID=UPI0021E41671|nr:hypothetical protein [Paucibacter sp. DJ2R-2]MCV2437177.1 hypothetical protein [Paucibacter sp. DJ2R-2]